MEIKEEIKDIRKGGDKGKEEIKDIRISIPPLVSGKDEMKEGDRGHTHFYPPSCLGDNSTVDLPLGHLLANQRQTDVADVDHSVGVGLFDAG